MIRLSTAGVVYPSIYIPGHALHENGLYKHIRKQQFTGQQPGTKSAHGPGDKPRKNHG